MLKRALNASEQAAYDKLDAVHQDPIGQYQIAQQDLLDALQKERMSQPTGMVHHYTGLNGLNKITRYGTLFLSDYTSMIDTSEIEYGFKIGMEIFRDEFENSAKTRRLKLLYQFVHLIQKDGLGIFFKGYVLSLSIKEDDLSQWREYGNREKGYCLSFDGPTLDRAFVEFTKEGKYVGGSFDVIYCEKRLRSQLRQLVLNALDTAMWLKDRPFKSMLRAQWEISAQMLYGFIFTALYFKHPNYEAEQEYRYFIGTYPLDAVVGRLTRTGKHKRPVDYFAMDWKSQHADALKRIWIGPGVDEAKGRATVAKASKRAELTVDDVRKSRTPQTRR